MNTLYTAVGLPPCLGTSKTWGQDFHKSKTWRHVLVKNPNMGPKTNKSKTWPHNFWFLQKCQNMMSWCRHVLKISNMGCHLLIIKYRNIEFFTVTKYTILIHFLCNYTLCMYEQTKMDYLHKIQKYDQIYCRQIYILFLQIKTWFSN